MAEALQNTQILSGVPQSLRDELLGAYGEIVRNYRERRWEPSELNAGKLCEVTYAIVRGHVDGRFPARAQKPSNMVDACRQLEQAPNTFSRSLRIQIPRMIMALYEIRNNRGVGHVGGDVNPNHMDATCVLQMSKWLVAELIRIFHGVSTLEASQTVDALVDRTLPIVWKVGDKLRILNPKASMKEKTLLILYHSGSPVAESDLFTWTEHSHRASYRRDVLVRAHRDKLVEFDRSAGTVEISPIGISHVEEKLLDS